MAVPGVPMMGVWGLHLAPEGKKRAGCLLSPAEDLVMRSQQHSPDRHQCHSQTEAKAAPGASVRSRWAELM